MGTARAPCAGPSGGHLSYRSTQAMLGLWLIMPLTAGFALYQSWDAPATWAGALVLAATLLPLLLLGCPALECSLHDGRRVLLGSPEERLAQFIRACLPRQR